MTAALEEGEWSAARLGRNLAPGKTRYPFYRRLDGPQGRSGRTENLVPTGIRSRTFQPVVSRYTDWATRHIYIYIYIYIYKEKNICYYLIYYSLYQLMPQMKSRRWYFSMRRQTIEGQDFTTPLRHTTLGRTPIWASCRPEAEISTSQYATLLRERYPCTGRIQTRNHSKRAIVDSRLIDHATTGIGWDDNVYSMFSISCFVWMTKWEKQ